MHVLLCQRSLAVDLKICVYFPPLLARSLASRLLSLFFARSSHPHQEEEKSYAESQRLRESLAQSAAQLDALKQQFDGERETFERAKAERDKVRAIFIRTRVPARSRTCASMECRRAPLALQDVCWLFLLPFYVASVAFSFRFASWLTLCGSARACIYIHTGGCARGRAGRGGFKDRRAPEPQAKDPAPYEDKEGKRTLAHRKGIYLTDNFFCLFFSSIFACNLTERKVNPSGKKNKKKNTRQAGKNTSIHCKKKHKHPL